MGTYIYRITDKTIEAKVGQLNVFDVVVAKYWCKPDSNWWDAMRGYPSNWMGESLRRLSARIAVAERHGEALLEKYAKDGIELVCFEDAAAIRKFGFGVVYKLTNWMYGDTPDYGTPAQWIIVPVVKNSPYFSLIPFSREKVHELEKAYEDAHFKIEVTDSGARILTEIPTT